MHIYHYVPLNGTSKDEYRRELIAKRQVYFSDPRTFDDALDCNVPGWEFAKDKLFDCRVFCLSMEERDDNLMFALYGDHHRGIRLRFTINQDLPLGECTTLAIGRPVEYFDRLPPYDEKQAHMYYYYKSTSWKYQSEYRVLIRDGCYREYGEWELTEIALGLKFDTRYFGKLLEWVREGRHSNISFKRAVFCSSNPFGFEYKAFLCND
jgi:hypothetical protein